MNQLANIILGLLLLCFTVAPALVGQDAATQSVPSRTAMAMVPVAIVIVFLIRRKRRNRAKAAE